MYFTSSQSIVAPFIVAKNMLEFLKPLIVKLHKEDQNIVHAYNLIDNCINNWQNKMDNGLVC